MDLVKVDVVRLQASQAGLASLDDVAAAVAEGVRFVVVHPVVDLRAEEDAVPAPVALEGLADKLLALSPRVHVGGVQHVHPGVERPVDHPAAVLQAGLVAKHHAAEGDRGNPDAGAAEKDGIHGTRSNPFGERNQS